MGDWHILYVLAYSLLSTISENDFNLLPWLIYGGPYIKLVIPCALAIAFKNYITITLVNLIFAMSLNESTIDRDSKMSLLILL